MLRKRRVELEANPEWKEKKAAAMKMVHARPEVREKNRESNRKRWTPELREARAIVSAKIMAEGRGAPWCGTNLEVAMAAILEAAGLEFEPQKRFGRYVVDFYLPQSKTVVETDGSFWNHHKNLEREKQRDAYLLEHGVSEVFHVTEKHLSGWI